MVVKVINESYYSVVPRQFWHFILGGFLDQTRSTTPPLTDIKLLCTPSNNSTHINDIHLIYINVMNTSACAVLRGDGIIELFV